MGAIADQIVAAVEDVHRAGFNRHLGGPGSRFDKLVEETLFHAPYDVETRTGNIGPDDGHPRPSVEVVWAAAPSVRFKVWGSASDLLAPNALAHFRPDELALLTAPCGGMAEARYLLPRWCDHCRQPLSVAHGHGADIAVIPISCGATVVLIALCGACEVTQLRPAHDLVLRADLD